MRRSTGFKIYAIPAIALLAAVAIGASYWQLIEQAHSKQGGLINYGVIWPGQLTRSGLPHTSQGWTWLHQQGVRSIVTFRTENDINYRQFGFDRVMRLALSDSVMPTEEQAVRYLKFIQDPGNQPVHIHCTAGRSRTGMMAALVRYSIDGWTMDRALEEARQYRGGKQLSGRSIVWLRAWAKSLYGSTPSTRRTALPKYTPSSYQATPNSSPGRASW
jgi:protein tyrosine/serine phosphatase